MRTRDDAAAGHRTWNNLADSRVHRVLLTSTPGGRRHRLLRVGVAPRGHARSDGGHRGGVQRVAAGGPFEAAQRQFAFGHRARPRASYGDALAAQHDLAGGGAAAHGASSCIGHALGAAQCDTVGFHHRRQHLLARVDAQAQESVANIAQNALHGQRDLNLRRHGPQCGQRVRLHLGGSFGCLRGNPHARACGSKEPPPQLTRSTDFGTSPADYSANPSIKRTRSGRPCALCLCPRRRYA